MSTAASPQMTPRTANTGSEPSPAKWWVGTSKNGPASNRAACIPLPRQPDPDDRRRRRLALPDHGARQIATLTAARRDELRRFRQKMTNILDELR
jgi:hypothetical protein